MTTFTRGRVWALAAAIALMASACGWFSGDDDDATDVGPSVTSEFDDQDDPTQQDPTDQDPTDQDPTDDDPTGPDCLAPALLPDQLGEVDVLISSTVLADFFSRRHDDAYVANQCWHDWTTDDCSAPGLGSTGLSYDFRHPCHRHDFGYRNFKRLEAASGTSIWNAANKFATDDQFLEDMREHCSSRPWYLKSQCLGWAQAYYYAVRAFG